MSYLVLFLPGSFDFLWLYQGHGSAGQGAAKNGQNFVHCMKISKSKLFYKNQDPDVNIDAGVKNGKTFQSHFSSKNLV